MCQMYQYACISIHVIEEQVLRRKIGKGVSVRNDYLGYHLCTNHFKHILVFNHMNVQV